MFFKYPASATSENWLHDFLVQAVRDIHHNADTNGPTLNWPGCIPTGRQDNLKKRDTLRDHLVAYETNLRRLDAANRSKVLACLDDQNQIENLLSAATSCPKITDLPKLIRKPIVDLFHYAFKILTELGVRDRQYEKIYEAAEDKVCPFCCCESFDAPKTLRYALNDNGKQIREALDHYLPKESYPFAAANLRNLAPMGGRCNHYKHNADVLWRAKGVRRKAVYPYAGNGIEISLVSSTPFAGKGGHLPKWAISFTPSNEESETWDEVFSLRKRLCRNILNPKHDRWLKDFCMWFVRDSGNTTPTNAEVIAGLSKYSELEAIKGLNSIEHYRVLVVKMFEHHCSRGDSKLLRTIKDIIKQAIPPMPPKSP